VVLTRDEKYETLRARAVVRAVDVRSLQSVAALADALDADPSEDIGALQRIYAERQARIEESLDVLNELARRQNSVGVRDPAVRPATLLDAAAIPPPGAGKGSAAAIFSRSVGEALRLPCSRDMPAVAQAQSRLGPDDAFTFDAIDRAQLTRACLRFGRRFTHRDLIALSGALPGSHLHVTYDDSSSATHPRPPFAPPPDTICIQTRHFSYTSNVLVQVPLHQGEPFSVRLEFMDVHPSARGQGIATRMLARLADQASALGVEEIEASCRRGFHWDDKTAPYSGWVFFPSMGFNCDVTVKEEAPHEVSDVRRFRLPMTGSDNAMMDRDAWLVHDSPKTLLDLLRTQEGRAWWIENGTTVEATFDLASGSRSRQVLQAALTARGIDPYTD
jgi:hypothetical protein